jgi:type I restriction enzyme S subunit
MSKVRLADVAEINPRGPRAGELSPEYICDFVPMVAVSEAGQVIVSDRLPYSDVSKGFTAFQNDDVLVAKITPCYENNKIALASVQSRYAFGSTEFHVIRCGGLGEHENGSRHARIGPENARRQFYHGIELVFFNQHAS